jgi:hypothetical protein
VTDEDPYAEAADGAAREYQEQLDRDERLEQLLAAVRALPVALPGCVDREAVIDLIRRWMVP